MTIKMRGEEIDDEAIFFLLLYYIQLHVQLNVIVDICRIGNNMYNIFKPKMRI